MSKFSPCYPSVTPCLTETVQSRNYLIDNLKGLLIYLVLFGHFVEFFRDIQIMGIIWKYIYLFHMPLFIFISGYLSTPNDSNVFKKCFDNLLVPLIALQILYELLWLTIFQKIHGATLRLAPVWSLWYLLSLVFWRIGFQLVYKIKFIIIISILLSIEVGLIKEIGRPLSLSRTIVLFPFFLIGYSFKKHAYLQKITENKNIVMVIIACIILGISLVFVVKTGLPFELYENGRAYVLIPLSRGTGMLFRFIKHIFSFLCILSLIIIVPKRKSFLSAIGKNSMVIYIIHAPITWVVGRFSFLFHDNIYVIIPLCGILSLIIVYLLGNDRLSDRYNGVIKKISTFLTNKTA